MNNYAIFKLGKLKTEKDFTDTYKHNERIYHVLNADPAREKDNVEMIDTMGMSYEDLYEQYLTDLRIKGTLQKTIRKDAVKGFEVILTYSREREDIDVEEWAKESLEWIDRNFNPQGHEIRTTDPETGEDKTYQVQNIKHAILHMDESKPHLHAFVVPIDDKGHLNSHYYNSGRQKFIQLQTDYAKTMKKFGLDRGEENSVATPVQMSRYYNNIKKAVEAHLPDPLPKETAEEYRKRAEEEVYQPALCSHNDQMVKKEQEVIHFRSLTDKKAYEALEQTQREVEFYNIVSDTYGHFDEPEEERQRGIVQILKVYNEIEKYQESHPETQDVEDVNRLIEEILRKEREEELAKEQKQEEEKDLR